MHRGRRRPKLSQLAYCVKVRDSSLLQLVFVASLLYFSLSSSSFFRYLLFMFTFHPFIYCSHHLFVVLCVIICGCSRLHYIILSSSFTLLILFAVQLSTDNKTLDTMANSVSEAYTSIIIMFIIDSIIAPA